MADEPALIEEDEASLLILLDDGCRGVTDPDFGVMVPDLGVVPPEEAFPVADDGDNSKGLASPSKGFSVFCRTNPPMSIQGML